MKGGKKELNQCAGEGSTGSNDQVEGNEWMDDWLGGGVTEVERLLTVQQVLFNECGRQLPQTRDRPSICNTKGHLRK